MKSVLCEINFQPVFVCNNTDLMFSEQTIYVMRIGCCDGPKMEFTEKTLIQQFLLQYKLFYDDWLSYLFVIGFWNDINLYLQLIHVRV